MDSHQITPPEGFTLDAPPPAGFTLDAPVKGPRLDVSSLFAGVDKVASALPPDEQARATSYLETVPDEQRAAETAALANTHFFEDAYGGKLDAPTIYANREAVRADYARQMGWDADGKPMDDLGFYARVQKHFKERREESGLIDEARAKMFKTFAAGDPNGRAAFTSALADMIGKPGYDPKRLDIYRTMAAQQWQNWQDMGQHYPGAVDAITGYVKAIRKGSGGKAESQDETLKRADEWDALKTKALDAIGSVSPSDQPAIMSLVTRNLEGAADGQEKPGGATKAFERVTDSALDLLRDASKGLFNATLAAQPAGPAQVMANSVATADDRRHERMLDQLVHGATDPNKGSNWLGEAALQTAAALPQMLAMLHPAGVALNFGALSEAARGHLEDAGVSPEQAVGLGALAAVPLTALQSASTQLVFGQALTGKLAGWALGNVEGKMGAELVAGYAKNVAATAGVETAGLGLIMAGQQMTEPAVQSVAALLDKTIPAVKWTGPDGEFAHMAAATPETLASMVPMILLGTGFGMLRNEAFARNTVHNRTLLEAAGVRADIIKQMQEMPAEQAADALQRFWKQREQGTPTQTAAIEKLNASTPKPAETDNTAKLAPDGTFAITKPSGEVVDRAASPEMAAQAVGSDNIYHLTDEDRAMMRAEEHPEIDKANSRGYTLRDLFLGKKDALRAAGLSSPLRLQSPSAAKAAGSLSGELKSMREGLPFSWFHNEGLNIEDGLQAQLKSLGFEATTPQDAMDLVMRAGIGEEIKPQGSIDLQSDEIARAYRPRGMHFGIIDPAMQRAVEWIRGIPSGIKNIWNELRGLPQFGKFKEIINQFNGEQQVRGMELVGAVKQIFKAVPDKLTREAMFASIEAGHDPKVLADWAAREKRASAKKVYDAAAKLTPDQVNYAKTLQAWFEAKHPQAVQAGLLEEKQKRDNYVPLMVDKDYDGPVGRANPKFKNDFSHAIARDFENSFDLENATDEKGQNLGLRVKTRDIAEVLAAYGSELDRVDLTRQALKALESAKAKASDGEPLVKGVNPVLHLGTTPDKGSTISNPSSATSENGVRYETLDHPAFKKWYFAGKDAEGNPVMSRGEMGLHPEIYQHMANILGRSSIRMWMESEGGAVANLAKKAATAVQEAQKFVKANMFSASAFHATHIGTRAAGNLVAPWELKRVDGNDPAIKNMMRLGLQLHGDNSAMQAVSEGLGGGQGYNVLAKVPGIGKVVDAITHLTFHDIIPAYKAATWTKLNERNLKIFSKDIASGRVTKDAVGYLTSKQVNARFGELNYNDLGANPTFQHILSLTTLAPDFWRSNLQNFKQVAVGLTGAKAGSEPAKAFVVTAGVMWLGARVLNKALSDDDGWHFEEPFRVQHAGRWYSFRTEVQDIAEMVMRPSQYLMGRLSPFGSAALEYLSGVNWRGEKVDFKTVLKETAGKAIPASLKWLPGVSAADEWATSRLATTTHFEQFLTSQGIKVGRDSPMTPAYKLAHEYKQAQGDEDKGGTYPVSKFQQMRYALEDGDMAKAQAERDRLVAEHKGNVAQVNQGFHSSVFHAWTGSAATDAKFKESLTPEDRATVEKAEAHRQKIWENYSKLTTQEAPEPKVSVAPVRAPDTGRVAQVQTAATGTQTRDYALHRDPATGRYSKLVSGAASFTLERDPETGRILRLQPA